MKLAIFDFDGTLFQDETYNILKDALKKHPTLNTKYPKYILSLVLPFYSYKLKLYPEVKMKYQMMVRYLRNFIGYTQKEMDDFFTEIAANMHGKHHPIVLERLKAHQADGHHIMVVSGSFTPLLTAYLKDFPIDTIIGTEIPYKHNIYQANQRLDYIQAQRKASVVKEHTFGQDIDWQNSYSYADSYTDLPILELVGNPIAVMPEDRLKKVAMQKGWEILN